jgi:hypothetical protein
VNEVALALWEDCGAKNKTNKTLKHAVGLITIMTALASSSLSWENEEEAGGGRGR